MSKENTIFTHFSKGKSMKKKSFFHIFPWKIPRFSDVFSPMWRMRPAPQPTSASASGGRTPAGPGGRRAPGRAHRAGRRPCQAPLRGLRAPETDLAAQGGPQPGGKGLDLWKKGRILWEKVGIIWGSGDIYIYIERERDWNMNCSRMSIHVRLMMIHVSGKVSQV